MNRCTMAKTRSMRLKFENRTRRSYDGHRTDIFPKSRSVAASWDAGHATCGWASHARQGHHSSLLTKSSAVTPRLSRSAGMCSERICDHWQAILVTRFATKVVTWWLVQPWQYNSGISTEKRFHSTERNVGKNFSIQVCKKNGTTQLWTWSRDGLSGAPLVFDVWRSDETIPLRDYRSIGARKYRSLTSSENCCSVRKSRIGAH